jgi:hypothetical protein
MHALILVLAALLFPEVVLAAGAPAAGLVYAGVVTDSAGKPPTAALNVKVLLFASAVDDGSDPLCSSKALQSTAGTGQFTAKLANCDVAIQASPDVWVQVDVAGAPMPRVKLAPAPYALEAGNAAGASGALAELLAGLKAGLEALTKQVGELAGKVGDLAAVKADVAAVKLAPKLSADQFDVDFGKPAAINFPTGKAIVQIAGMFEGQSLGWPVPILTVDGQSVGQGFHTSQVANVRAFSEMVLVNASPGLHLVGLGSATSISYSPKCLAPMDNTLKVAPCSAIVIMLP